MSYDDALADAQAMPERELVDEARRYLRAGCFGDRSTFAKDVIRAHDRGDATADQYTGLARCVAYQMTRDEDE